MANPTLAFRLVDEYSDVEFHVSARGLSAALGDIEAKVVRTIPTTGSSRR